MRYFFKKVWWGHEKLQMTKSQLTNPIHQGQKIAFQYVIIICLAKKTGGSISMTLHICVNREVFYCLRQDSLMKSKRLSF